MTVATVRQYWRTSTFLILMGVIEILLLVWLVLHAD
jgi:predicted nucleic acid-binding Zn ribbon protein